MEDTEQSTRNKKAVVASATTLGSIATIAVSIASHAPGSNPLVSLAVGGVLTGAASIALAKEKPEMYAGLEKYLPSSLLPQSLVDRCTSFSWQELRSRATGAPLPEKRPVPQPKDEPAQPEHTALLPETTKPLPDEVMEPLQSRRPVIDFNAKDELAAPRRISHGPFLFSEVLKRFKPTLDKIYLCTLDDGTMIFVKAEDLCHVALAGATRGGKSSLMRMLQVQLCAAGASVLHLNPHYSRYILDKQEDWTPFDPYLIYDPMECRHYDVIEHYLRQVAEDLLPKRLDKYAHSQPFGRPYFIIMDEVPAIIEHIPDAPKYLKVLLREGAKVGIFLITAAQDFLVNTLFPGGQGGAVRDCYRTVMYVGGDGTTAKVLLDMPAKDVPETKLGKGTIMVRCDSVRPAALARVPLVDNESLYYLLGPSTYVPGGMDESEEDDLVTGLVGPSERSTDPEIETVTQVRSAPRMAHSHMVSGDHTARARARAERFRSAPVTSNTPARKQKEPTLLERGIEAYKNGKKSQAALAAAVGISPWEARTFQQDVINAINDQEAS